jgi:hypothetical protein
MKDFKKLPKMACGGGVGKYNNGGDVDLDAYVRKSTGLAASKNTAATPSAAVKRNVGPTPNINDVVRKSMGVVKKYDDAPEPSTSIPKYTGPEVNVNDLVKSQLKKGGKVKRGNKKK